MRAEILKCRFPARWLNSCFFFKPWPTYYHKKRNKIQVFLSLFYYIECDTPKQQNSFIQSTMKFHDVRTVQFWPPFVPRAHPPYARRSSYLPRFPIPLALYYSSACYAGYSRLFLFFRVVVAVDCRAQRAAISVTRSKRNLGE